MDTISDKRITARKPHVCDYCGGQIEVGEEYDLAKVADSGRVWTWKSHIICGLFAANHIEDDVGDGIDQDVFCDAIDGIARIKGLDTELDTYELVKKIMEAKG
jgi:hypothetical protein